MAVPYTREDKEVLVQILKNYPVIVNKRTDASTIKKKNAAWSSVMDDFNAGRTSEKRTTVQLKRCWDKIKRKRKEELAEERRSRMLTGGGESIPDKDIIPDVDEIVPHLTEYVQNPFDTDGIFEERNKSRNYLDISKFSHTIITSQSSVVQDMPHTSSSSPTNNSESEYKENSCSAKPHKCGTETGKAVGKSVHDATFKKGLAKPKVVEKSDGDLKNLFKERIENAKIERQQLTEIYEIRKEEAKEKREEAKIKRQIAETELLIKEEELKQARLKRELQNHTN